MPMASESSPAGQLTASRLLTSLKIQHFCDDIGDQDLTPEQQAVRDWGEAIQKKGIDLMVIATGAYGDPKLWKRHLAVAAKSAARLRLPSGAIAGLDGLLAMRHDSLSRVKYLSIKPPHAWIG